MLASRKDLYEAANEILKKDKFWTKKRLTRRNRKRRLTRKTDKYR